MPDSTPSSDSRRGLDRRTVLVTAAWSVPVVAAAIATPLAAASGEPTRTVSASSRVSVRPAGDPTWDDEQYGVGKLLVPYSPVVLGLSFTNLGDPLQAGEIYIEGLLTSAAKNAAGQDLFRISGANNNNWAFVATGTPQHAATSTDASYPVWFRYQLPLATGQTSSTVYFTLNPTGAVADRRYVNGVLQIPGQILYSRAYINPDLSTIPAGSAVVPAEFVASWSRVPLPGVTDHFHIEPAPE
jgi:hypothetical protein